MERLWAELQEPGPPLRSPKLAEAHAALRLRPRAVFQLVIEHPDLRKQQQQQQQQGNEGGVRGGLSLGAVH